jgi:transposase
MRSLPIHVGLDYHQESVRVCLLSSSGERMGNKDCPNDWQAIARFSEGRGRVMGAAIEACTGSADLADELALKAGWSVHLAHPGYVARMKQTLDKTDCGDAQVLADLERVGYLPRVWLPPQETRELRRLVRYRQQLVNQRRSHKLRITAVLRDLRVAPAAKLSRWTQAWWKWLAKAPLSEQGRWIIERHQKWLQLLASEIREVESRLVRLTQDDPMVRRLLQFNGIGLVTAWVIRAEIGRFDRFRSGKQVSRFCGLSPRNASSGSRQSDAGLIQAGNPLLRATLIEAAHRLTRLDPRWQRLSLRMRARGKPGSVVAAAIGNRWMRWLYYRMLDLAPPNVPAKAAKLRRPKKKALRKKIALKKGKELP